MEGGAVDDQRPKPVPDPAQQRAQVAATFDLVASTYDAVGVDFFQPIAAGLVDALAPEPGEVAIDIGCGRGAVTHPVASAVGPTGRVTAIDLSPRMVQSTAQDVAAAGLAGFVDVRIGDAQHPDLPAGSADLVASSLVLFFLPDPAAAVRAWRDLLRDGGRLGVSTFGATNEEWRAVDDVLRPFMPTAAADPRTREGGPFGSDAAMEALLVGAGYVEVRTVTRTVPVRFVDADQWYAWSMSVGQRRMWDAVPPDEFDAVRARAVVQVERCRDAQGRIGFDQGVRYTLGRVEAER